VGDCRYSGAARVVLDPGRPLVLLVHGCNDSGGRFRALARVFRDQDRQAICFNYDDRRSLEVTSSQLIRALDMLATRLDEVEITVIGHSQGGLVARRALIREREDRLQGAAVGRIDLVTVSSPFGGIRAASHCGLLPLHIASLGITAGVCQLAAGATWTEIHPRARFIQEPGTLLPGVARHLKVITDERGACLARVPDGPCAESDEVFSMAEQRNPVIDRDPRAREVVVRAGHVAIVGDTERPPLKLVRVLQQHRILDAPGAREERAFLERLMQLYTNHAAPRRAPP
jgi:pimeloyl-ACP methyl ester carboxylesterase